MSAQVNPFRFAIVGSGNIAGTYVQAIQNLGDVELTGIVSRSGRRPEGVSEALPVVASISELKDRCDAIALATPNGLHHQGAIEAAQQGLHVLTEKVLDISRPAMDRMSEACRAAGVTLAVAFQRRMSPDNQAVKKLLETGALGRVLAADMSVKFYRGQDYYDSGAYRGKYDIDGGGAFIQQAAHNADLLCWFFGMPDKVASMLGTLYHEIEAEDHGIALLHYPNGMIGSFCASTICKPGFPSRLDVHTEVGSFVMENDQIVAWKIEGLENPTTQIFDVHDGATSMAVSDTAGHEAIIRDFVDAIREGRAPLIPAESGRLATELILQIYEQNLLVTR